ncbi:hypothetical protein BGZ83_005213 [Gryganskiella cystojenkinii]|nr:hypothetical protein BGZ83_005213 [Gryganskiella cystojenkinii]
MFVIQFMGLSQDRVAEIERLSIDLEKPFLPGRFRPDDDDDVCPSTIKDDFDYRHDRLVPLRDPSSLPNGFLSNAIRSLSLGIPNDTLPVIIPWLTRAGQEGHLQGLEQVIFQNIVRGYYSTATLLGRESFVRFLESFPHLREVTAWQLALSEDAAGEQQQYQVARITKEVALRTLKIRSLGFHRLREDDDDGNYDDGAAATAPEILSRFPRLMGLYVYDTCVQSLVSAINSRLQTIQMNKDNSRDSENKIDPAYTNRNNNDVRTQIGEEFERIRHFALWKLFDGCKHRLETHSLEGWRALISSPYFFSRLWIWSLDMTFPETSWIISPPLRQSFKNLERASIHGKNATIQVLVNPSSATPAAAGTCLKLRSVSVPTTVQNDGGSDEIASFLDPHSLAVCIRVSKEWHQTFLPFLWSDIDIDLTNCPDGPLFANLDKNASLIERLCLRSEGTPFIFAASVGLADSCDDDGNDDEYRYDPSLKLFCPKLKVLKLEVEEGYGIEIEDSAVAWIEGHHSTLKVVEFGTAPVKEKIFDVLCACPKLERVSLSYLRGVEGPCLWMKRYESLWSRLHSLDLSYVLPSEYEEGEEEPSIEDKTDIPALLARLADSRLETRIQDLRVIQDKYDRNLHELHAMLIKKSPRLLRLQWMCGLMDWFEHERSRCSPVQLLADSVLAKKSCQSLELLSLSAMSFENEDLRRLLSGLQETPLTSLDLSGTTFDTGAWAILRDNLTSYLTKLTTLNLKRCEEVSGTVAQDVLCSMPNLEHFEADFIIDSDIEQDDRPWVCCRALKVLSIAFLFNAREQNQASVLSRIASLQRIEMLDLTSDFLLDPGQEARTGGIDFDDPNEGLQLSLSQGLDQLRDLKRLTTLKAPSSSYVERWKEDEARWVLEHWPRMHRLGGFRFEGEREVEAILHSRGIRFFW